MSDYIDRQAAIDALFELYEYQRDIDPTEAADLVRQGVYLAEKKIEQLPSVQPDHIADVSKKEGMMHEYIYKIVQDCDGVSCYIKQGKIIRCKDCKHKHVENMVWTCPFGLPGGENFFCGYGTEPYKGGMIWKI